MPKKGITGHDGHAAPAWHAKHQPRKHMDDIRKLLAAGCQQGTVNLHLAQAKCRLFPGADHAAIYREYGLEDREV